MKTVRNSRFDPGFGVFWTVFWYAVFLGLVYLVYLFITGVSDLMTQPQEYLKV